MEGVLVVAKVTTAQTVSWWEDGQGEVDRTFSVFLGRPLGWFVGGANPGVIE